jgi:phage terminase large subunit-like protein
MSSNFTEREIQRQFEEVISQTAVTETETPAIEWGEANPSKRPDGMDWDPESNILTYDTWEAQRRAIEKANKENVDILSLTAGYGSGKSIIGARWLIKKALEYDNSRFLALGIDFQKARDSTFRVLFEQLPGDRTGIFNSSFNGPEQSPLVSDYNQRDHRLTFTNDTVIKLGSADRWNRYAGDSFGAVWADEVGHYGDDLHDLLEMLGSRLRGVGGPQTQLWTLTGNGKNAAFDIIERGLDANGDKIGLNIATVKASTLENPYLSDSEKERFKRQYGNTSREGQALHGGFSAGEGNLLNREQLSFVDESEYDGGENLVFYIGVDLAYVESKRKANDSDSDYTAAVLVGYDRSNGKALVLDVERERGMTLRQSITWLSKFASRVPQPTVKIEDVAAQKWFIQEAKRKVQGTIQSVSPGNQSKQERITDMSVLFERGDVKLCNHSVDENLGYDKRHRPFVREWIEFGSGSSPDLLDAAYYALQDVDVGRGYESEGIVMETGDIYGRRRGRK